MLSRPWYGCHNDVRTTWPIITSTNATAQQQPLYLLTLAFVACLLLAYSLNSVYVQFISDGFYGSIFGTSAYTMLYRMILVWISNKISYSLDEKRIQWCRVRPCEFWYMNLYICRLFSVIDDLLFDGRFARLIQYTIITVGVKPLTDTNSLQVAPQRTLKPQ